MCLMYQAPVCICCNLFLSVAIVLLNKCVYVKTGFPNVTLTWVHFVLTFIGLKTCERARIFKVKQLPISSLLPLGISFCGFVVFTNLSLGHNTVGTYQIIKTLTMPTIICIQRLVYGRMIPLKVQLTLVPIFLGVYLNSAYDIKFNVPGTVYALIGVIVTSFYQVWVGEKQKEFQVNSMQLLYYLAPLSATLLLICLPAIEPPWKVDGVFYQHQSFDNYVIILASGIFAFLVNLSIYWIIGNTSAITYNVVGQLKFCLTLLGGYLFFQESVLPIQFLGIFLTFMGVSMYAYLKIEEQKTDQLLPVTSK